MFKCSGILKQLRYEALTRSAAQKLNNWLLPAYCDLCSRLLSSDATSASGLCTVCSADLPRNESPCRICAEPETAGEKVVCGQCQTELQSNNSFLDETFSPYLYQSGVAKLIQQFKYNKKLYLANVLARLLSEILENKHLSSATLVPIPLHKKRLRSRGYNQALEIARILQKQSGARLLVDSVERTRATETQTALPFAQRAANVNNAFAANISFSGEHVFLIDDVMTTGSTIKEVAKVLKKAGASKVSAAVIAHA